MSDAPVIVQFFASWADTGEVSADGLPKFREATMISFSKPPSLHVVEEASEDYIATYHDEYRQFEKAQKSRTMASGEGYPLALWPALNDYHLRILAVRDIFTVEQLAKLSKRKDMPQEITALAIRAADMVAQMAKGPKWEPLVNELKGQVAALTEQVEDCMKTIAAQKDMIQTLKIKVA